ncbi:MAG: hypothetical protein D6808_03415 [Candidatus Dadabacteria bacterium]|nr:MAG: hypothetical protein D6808_03415 [Candidatus Dadabacteria bacterium]
MGNSVLERLFSSFTELEQAIGSAKASLEKRDFVPESIIERIRSYDEILEKQRSLAVKLCDHINKGQWEEVARHVNLINGLSAMIRDDAKAILRALSGNPDELVDDTKCC